MEKMDIGLESEAESDSFIARKRERMKFCYVVFFLMNYVISFFLHPHTQIHKHTSDLLTVHVCVCVCVIRACVLMRCHCLESVSTPPPPLPNISISREFAAIFSVRIPCKELICFCLQIFHNHFFSFFFLMPRTKFMTKCNMRLINLKYIEIFLKTLTKLV